MALRTRQAQFCDAFLGSRDCLPRFGNATRFSLRRKVLIKLSCFHACDDSVERRDKLILVRNHDRCLTLLELHRLRPVADCQPDCSKRIFTPPRAHSLLQLNEFFVSRFVANPL